MDPYRVLGVSRDATLAEIEAAYQSRREKYNPDVAWEEWELVQLQEAYEQIRRDRTGYAEKGTVARREPGPASRESEAWEDETAPAGMASRNPDQPGQFLWAYSGVIGGAFFGALVGAIAASSLGGSSFIGGVIGVVVGALAGNLGGAAQPPAR
jgi:DnaJ-class molecular chaperone